MRAPTISPLHGQHHRDNIKATERMIETLRTQMRNLVHAAQEHLAQVYLILNPSLLFIVNDDLCN